MVYCKYCEVALDDDAVFCTGCGKQIELRVHGNCCLA